MLPIIGILGRLATLGKGGLKLGTVGAVASAAGKRAGRAAAKKEMSESENENYEAGTLEQVQGEEKKQTPSMFAKIATSLGSAFTPNAMSSEEESYGGGSPITKIASTENLGNEIIFKLNLIDSKLNTISKTLLSIGTTISDMFKLQKERFDNFELARAKSIDDKKTTGSSGVLTRVKSGTSSLIEGIPYAMLLAPLAVGLAGILGEKLTPLTLFITRAFLPNSALFTSLEGLTKKLIGGFGSITSKFITSLERIQAGFSRAYAAVASMGAGNLATAGTSTTRTVGAAAATAAVNAPGKIAGITAKESIDAIAKAGFKEVVNPVFKTAADALKSGFTIDQFNKAKSSAAGRVMPGTFYMKEGIVASADELTKLVTTYGGKLGADALKAAAISSGTFTGTLDDLSLKSSQIASSSPSRYRAAANITSAFGSMSKAVRTDLFSKLSSKDQKIAKTLFRISQSFAFGSKMFAKLQSFPKVGKYIKYFVAIGGIAYALYVAITTDGGIGEKFAAGATEIVKLLGLVLGAIIGDLTGAAAGAAAGALLSAPIALILGATGIGAPAGALLVLVSSVTGAVLGFTLGTLFSFYGAALGSYLAEKIGQVIFTDKTGGQVIAEIINDAKTMSVNKLLNVIGLGEDELVTSSATNTATNNPGYNSTPGAPGASGDMPQTERMTTNITSDASALNRASSRGNSSSTQSSPKPASKTNAENTSTGGTTVINLNGQSQNQSLPSQQAAVRPDTPAAGLASNFNTDASLFFRPATFA
jgi:hypothetical protein